MNLGQERAEILALQALAFIASDEELLSRFIALTGMNVDGLKAAAAETGTLIAVMDFIMFDDSLIVRFAEFVNLSPDIAGQIRYALAGPEVDPL
jgi:hypothetical protein